MFKLYKIALVKKINYFHLFYIPFIKLSIKVIASLFFLIIMINNQMAFYFWLKALRKGKFRIENLHVTI